MSTEDSILESMAEDDDIPWHDHADPHVTVIGCPRCEWEMSVAEHQWTNREGDPAFNGAFG